MDRRFSGRAALAAACAALALPAAAQAQLAYNMTDWNLTDTASSWGGGTQFHISSGFNRADFRWDDSPNKTTVISGNSCADLSAYGSSTYSIGDTGFHTLFAAPSSTCFVMRGRTAVGTGSMVNHDGVLNR